MSRTAAGGEARLVELSHVIENGMTTYRGLPGPVVCDYWSREEMARHYDDGARFQIGIMSLVGNTGTYVDAPFHRFDEGEDFSTLDLRRLAALPGIVIRSRAAAPDHAVDAEAFDGLELEGRAVLVHTGWDRHWRTLAYQQGHPFLTEAAAQRLADGGAALVGIDSHNIDDTRARLRPVHSLLLGRGIPICEHLTGLERLPDRGFNFTAAPPRIVGMGSFPVRAFAELDPASD